MDTGRKIWLTASALAMGFLVTILGRADAGFFNMVGAVVLGFNGANAAITWKSLSVDAQEECETPEQIGFHVGDEEEDESEE